jgi:formate C-acetyltransferase
MTNVISPYSQLLELKEYFGAGLFEEPNEPMINRITRGLRREMEFVNLAHWEGSPFYPEGISKLWRTPIISFHYSSSISYNRSAMLKLIASQKDPQIISSLQEVDGELRNYNQAGESIEPKYALGGRGYTHSIPNFRRILKEGLNSYENRILLNLNKSKNESEDSKIEFYKSLKDLLIGIHTFHNRCIEKIRNSDIEEYSIKDALLSALKQVPFYPARSFYEAILATNFIFYLDGCDSLGRFDQDLYPYYEHDKQIRKIEYNKALSLVRLFFRNIDINDGWNMAIGGSRHDRTPAYNELTTICLEAARNMRRPNLALRVRKDMPNKYWNAALKTIETGCGLPALYNEEVYIKALNMAHLNLKRDDVYDYAFGGCTETMVHGLSNVGSLDGGINLLEILVETLESYFLKAKNFEKIMKEYMKAISEAITKLTSQVNTDQYLKAQFRPQPLRSLLIDDCIDLGLDYNSGGARYNWSVINVAGLANVVDSLMAIKKLVFDTNEIDAAYFWRALEDDFQGYELLQKRIAQCPTYGNDEIEVDKIANKISTFVFHQFSLYKPWRGGSFLPACLMFVTYADAGSQIMATPDGRRKGMPIADSAGPMQGRDQSGPTALMRSVSHLNHIMAPGTLVVNIRFTRSLFDSNEGHTAIQNLIKTYFSLGCLQIQVNVVDQKVLMEAISNPEKHGDLIVRVGGYSEYFNRLSPELKYSILKRIEHGK